MAETSRETVLARPIREISRLARVNAEREEQHGKTVSSKFRLFSIAICLMLAVPRFRRAFRDAVSSSDWDSMLPDERDRFWMCVRTGYRFMGRSDEERRKMINGLRVAKIRKNI